ncbi:double-strand break repair helicase AddA [Aurantiacibacter poecillastricola]|uniref:double-strand break repair helicase AddA n=1 Tax=Aurantiacibacter poecillastricola TaxID=3064385 RepID=UPI00273E51F9|nr:double-strand break repair helicase AddA [Aurantiacibacter sp. 219JJ12-13]MDP5262205.1 double-strand break repair helicase AddA [Aurantiacibacter sp. 219JJ12-13]
MSGKVFPLKDNQALAVEPMDSVWLSASAGTGKTQVLSARVLRLLLTPGVQPEQILCLTFTKAGAAEMATRVNEVLANWVRMEDTRLARDLVAIGAEADADTLSRARTLFAAVLDCPGGGLRIDTIHAFSQWLLAAFPEEAGLVPGTRPMEDRDRDLLADRVLRELLVEWEEGDPAAVTALEDLSRRMGPEGARGWLMRCAAVRDAWIGPAAWQPPMEPRVKRLLGLEADATRDGLADLCADDAFDCEGLRNWRAVHADWGTKTALGCIEAIDNWLSGDPKARLDGCEALAASLFTQKGDVRSLSSLEKKDPAVADYAARVNEHLAAIREQAMLLDLVDVITPAFEVGRKFALRWDEAKGREGLVDFDDLIARAADLLATKDMSAWIRYKLDRRFDHILVDEAQDTNSAQWAIIDALTDDFFAGLGQAEERLRTIFVVGDYKQAIFRFQGTSPENFAAARAAYDKRLREWFENAARTRQASIARELQKLGLGRSYRTAQSVLGFVDEAIDAIGPDNFGLAERPEPHVGDDRPGLVTLWAPVPGHPDEVEDGGEDGPEIGISEPERRMAEKIAMQIKRMCERGFPLVKDRDNPRNATPGDFMVLVRKRKELAGLIVARLHAAGVPVAGVDRLRLGAPLAVKDLMAALRFAAQPRNDLSLANLLVSPILGWSQEDLLAYVPREKGVALWDHLRDLSAEKPGAAVEMLSQLLARADFETPQALLHWILLGPWKARGKLVARLGREANDPIDELLGAAQQFAASNTPSLQGFIRWFDAGDGELKRETEGQGDMVRVMTVHGSKGLQAPIVILADACGNPDASRQSGLELEEEVPGGGKSLTLPLPSLQSEERVGRIEAAAEAAKAAEREEHWRLLYVAMTRAEEALFIGGALGKREKEPAEDSWYARLAPLFDAEPLADDIWEWRLELGERAPVIPDRSQQALPIPPVLPVWATQAIGPEPRPPRPLAPSAAADEQGADPPLPAAQAAIAARRGVLIHALLERLPDTPRDLRESGGRAWLARRAPDVDESEREEMLERALAVLDEPEWRDLFGPDALAEVPLAATVGEQVIAGTADRLLVTSEKVLVADFKTARRPPASLAEMPEGTLRQMGAYAAALAVIYPDRTIEAAVLYTQTPRLIAAPSDILIRHKPG